MNLQDWPGLHSDGGFPITKEESAFWRLGRQLAPWLTIAVIAYFLLSHIIKTELHDTDLKLTTNAIAIQHIQEDINSVKHDMGMLKNDIKNLKQEFTDVKVGLSKMEVHLLQLQPPSSRTQD